MNLISMRNEFIFIVNEIQGANRLKTNDFANDYSLRYISTISFFSLLRLVNKIKKRCFFQFIISFNLLHIFSDFTSLPHITTDSNHYYNQQKTSLLPSSFILLKNNDRIVKQAKRASKKSKQRNTLRKKEEEEQEHQSKKHSSR